MIEIKTIDKMEDFWRLPEIEMSAWDFSELEVEPHHLMARVQKYGGLVQGLFIDGKMEGFSYAIIGKWEGEYFIYSHMAAVTKEYQGRGFGFMLKKAQRDEILMMGYDIIRWNFDPLESLNAYFNLHRLGAISDEYERNVYGEGRSGLHKGLPTDRLIATWQLKSQRVIQRIENKVPQIREDVPSELVGTFEENIAYIEIPSDIRRLRETKMQEAKEWRFRTRELFEYAFEKLYIVTDFVFSPEKERIFYKLQIKEFENGKD